jgi:hypothetical protein
MTASLQPVFSTTAQTAWVGIGIGALLPVPGSPRPIGQDPAHRYISNDESGVTRQQPTQRISDISNPNLKQWAKDVMKKDNDEVLAGKFAFTARSSCHRATTIDQLGDLFAESDSVPDRGRVRGTQSTVRHATLDPGRAGAPLSPCRSFRRRKRTGRRRRIRDRRR